MVKIYTSRINNTDPDALNITVKSASTAIGRYLAPSKSMVYGHKAGQGDARFERYTPLSDEQYTERYYQLLRPRYRNNPKLFHDLLLQDKVILCCYCRAGDFCHRHLAADILMKIALAQDIPVELCGEI
ncbi:MAG: hypothetical protein AAFV93_08230 [Chloroflexota bacterium]